MSPEKNELNKHMKLWASRLGIVAMFALAGCNATQQPRGPLSTGTQESGFLGDLYPQMQEGEEGRALRYYLSPRVETMAANAYNKVFLDKVTIYFGPESKLNEVPQDQLQTLADKFTGQLAEQLSKDYQLVSEPGPKTLRIQTAITDAHPTSAAKALSFVPWGVPGAKFAVTKGTEAATGKPVLSGEVTAEMKMMDAQTGDVLWAAVDRRVGGRLGGGWEAWTDAEKAFQFWAEKVRYGLCQRFSHKTECIAPQE